MEPPDIRDQVRELKENGWTARSATLWQSPRGKLHVGPHGAWKAMKAAAASRAVRPMASIATAAAPVAPREPKVVYTTVRDAVGDDGELENHIECRFDDDQKFAPITVDGDFPELAMRVSSLLNGPPADVVEAAAACKRYIAAGRIVDGADFVEAIVNYVEGMKIDS